MHIKIVVVPKLAPSPAMAEVALGNDEVLKCLEVTILFRMVRE